MPYAMYNPKIWDAAHEALRSAPKAPCSTILVTVLPGWQKPVTLKVSHDTYYVYLESRGMRLAVCG